MKLLMAFAIGIAGACLLAPSAANAQASRTWVSGLGDDANPCSRTAPCKTFAGAYSKTAAWGEINCIETGGYGAVSISKSLAIKCDNTEAGILVAGPNGITINAASTDVIYISGIDFEGLGPTSTSLNGIKINSGGIIHVENCVIRGFGNTNGTDGNGIAFSPSSASKLVVENTIIADNFAVGIEVAPIMGATATAQITNVSATGNAVGIRANGTTGGGAINMNIDRSVASHNGGSGIAAVGANGQIMVKSSTIAFNGAFGLNGNGGTIRVGYSDITGNGTATNGATVFSYGNNQINGNTADTIPAAVPGGLH